MNIVIVFVGGGLGAALRYLLQLGIGKSNGFNFPTATFLANIIGCLLIGIAFGFIQKLKLSDNYNLFIITGILGGFTTFSSFGLEFIQLFNNKQYFIALVYCLGSNILGFALAWLGYCFLK